MTPTQWFWIILAGMAAIVVVSKQVIRMLERSRERERTRRAEEDAKQEAARNAAALQGLNLVVVIRKSGGKNSPFEGQLIERFVEAGVVIHALGPDVQGELLKGNHDVIPEGSFAVMGYAEELRHPLQDEPSLQGHPFPKRTLLDVRIISRSGTVKGVYAGRYTDTLAVLQEQILGLVARKASQGQLAAAA